jgi:hypothetical protein
MRRPTFFLLLALLSLSACDAPRFEGPMVQALPNGFVREPTAGQDHDIFPERESLMRDAYVVFGAMQFSGIYMRKHPGGTTRAGVDEARRAAAAVEGPKGVTYGPVEDIQVDGNAAWGWLEERHDQKGLQSVEYRAVIPYADSVTYTVEFTSAKFTWMSNPDSMRFVATSFAIGKVEWDYPLIAALALGAFLLFSFIWNKVSVKNPSTSYTLHPLPTPKTEADPDAEGRADPGAPDAT